MPDGGGDALGMEWAWWCSGLKCSSGHLHSVSVPVQLSANVLWSEAGDGSSDWVQGKVPGS